MPGDRELLHADAGLEQLAKLVGRLLAEARTIPPFAPQTFKQWFARRGAAQRGQAAGDSVGRHVQQPLHAGSRQGGRRRSGTRRLSGARAAQSLCCGRPLYDYGMLDTAKALLRQIARARCAQPIRAGMPIVGLEPSCMTVFRDELTNLLHGDEDAKRLQQPELHPQRISADKRRTISRRSCSGKRSFTGTATTSRCCISKARSTC